MDVLAFCKIEICTLFVLLWIFEKRQTYGYSKQDVKYRPFLCIRKTVRYSYLSALFSLV